MISSNINIVSFCQIRVAVLGIFAVAVQPVGVVVAAVVVYSFQYPANLPDFLHSLDFVHHVEKSVLQMAFDIYVVSFP
jgi:hypothetical protein